MGDGPGILLLSANTTLELLDLACDLGLAKGGMEQYIREKRHAHIKVLFQHRQ